MMDLLSTKANSVYQVGSREAHISSVRDAMEASNTVKRPQATKWVDFLCVGVDAVENLLDTPLPDVVARRKLALGPLQ